MENNWPQLLEKSKQEGLMHIVYFDPITDLAVGMVEPDGHSTFLPCSRVNLSKGSYILHPDFWPLGRTAEELLIFSYLKE